MTDSESQPPTVPADLVAMLDLLAETIVQALGFGVACVNIARDDGTMQVVSVAGDDDARRMLLGTVDSAAIWDELLAMSEPWGRLRFADHRSEVANVESLTWIPDIDVVDAEDAWHPEDALFAPLTAEDGTRLGILSVDLPRDGRRPDATTRSALEAFAVSTALAIEHAALRARAEASEQRYKQLAVHDQLTGLGNRSLLLDRLGHALSLRPDQRRLLAVVFIDLDGFKTVNDTHSHEAGDQVLRTVANRLSALVRPHDTLVRWGGDEFLLLLEPLDDESAALTVVGRIAASLAEPIRLVGQHVSVTASVGVAFGHPRDEVGVEQLIRRSDAAMYRAKRGGRNRSVVFDSATDGPQP